MNITCTYLKIKILRKPRYINLASRSHDLFATVCSLSRGGGIRNWTRRGWYKFIGRGADTARSPWVIERWTDAGGPSGWSTKKWRVSRCLLISQIAFGDGRVNFPGEPLRVIGAAIWFPQTCHHVSSLTTALTRLLVAERDFSNLFRRPPARPTSVPRRTGNAA